MSLYFLLFKPITNQPLVFLTIDPSPQMARYDLSSSLKTKNCLLKTAVPGGRAYSALPCAGAPPPQRPLSYNLAPQRLCGQCEVGVPRRPAPPPPHLG